MIRRPTLLTLSILVLAASACTSEVDPNPQSNNPQENSMSETNASADEVQTMLADFAKQNDVDTSNPQWRLRLPQPPKAEFPPGVEYFWNLETSEGAIQVKLFPDEAPMHVTSTIYLTQLGFYDDLKFHRVITGFMAQGGCPLGQGTGGPGYKYAGEFGRQRHDRPGLLSMANAGPGTDGSQFFLTFVPTPWLDNKHTIFGEVVDGMGVLETLESYGSSSGNTSKELKIVSATITAK